MEYKKIGELTSVVTGGTPKTSHPEYWENGEIPWLQSGCCQNCDVYSSEKYITKEGYDNSSTRLMPADTVMIALTGATAGKIGYLRFEACGNQSITGIFPCNSLNQRYLFYFLISQRERILSDCIGGAQPHISQGYVKDIKIPIPTMEEQQSIVKRLETTRQLIDQRQNEIKLLDQLIKARFVEMFRNMNPSWPTVSIGDICTDARTGPFGSALHHDEFVNDGIFVLGIDNAVENRFSFNRMRYITEEKYQQLKRYTVYPGDVIITIMGTVGRSAVIPNDMPLAINTKHLACLTPDYAKVDSIFLCSAFQMHPDVQRQLNSNTKGAIMDGLNLGIIKGLEFQLPPLQKQKDFEFFYSQVDKSKCDTSNITSATQYQLAS